LKRIEGPLGLKVASKDPSKKSQSSTITLKRFCLLIDPPLHKDVDLPKLVKEKTYGF